MRKWLINRKGWQWTKWFKMFERLPKMFGNLSKEREISEKIWKEWKNFAPSKKRCT